MGEPKVNCRCRVPRDNAKGVSPDAVGLMMPDLQFRASHRQNQLVGIDRCISETISTLWDFGVRTLGCCCGHNQPRLRGPTIVLHEREDPDRVRRLLERIDERYWRLLQWRDELLRELPSRPRCATKGR